jgi:hypothetical protein
MISGFFKNLFQVVAFACVLTVLYLNVIIVPDSHVGLLVEKTRGLSKPLLKPGYHWNWTGFVPYKWNFYSIDLNPPVVNIHIRQPLRYGRYLEDADIFSINLNINVKYTLDEKSVLFFWNYLKNNVPEYNNYISDRVRLMVELFLNETYRREEDVAFLNAFFRKYISNEGRFKKDWNEIFKEEGVELTQYEITKLEIPEAAVYFENIKNIDKIFQARRDATVKRLLAEAGVYEKNLLDHAELEKTEKFIELMKKYPDIIKYYQIEKLNPKANIILLNDPTTLNEIIKNAVKQPDIKTTPPPAPPEEKGKIEAIKK